MLSNQFAKENQIMSYADQLRKLADEFFEAEKHGASAREILRWAWENKKWEPHPDDFLRAGAEQLARAMRDDYEKDPQGRAIRTNHVVYEDRGGEQIPIWIDYQTATREQMVMAFQGRRGQISNDCVQLFNDVNSYNENRNPAEPIQIVFNFSFDLEEQALAQSIKKSVKKAG
jgi:hypothetical protein